MKDSDLLSQIKKRLSLGKKVCIYSYPDRFRFYPSSNKREFAALNDLCCSEDELAGYGSMIDFPFNMKGEETLSEKNGGLVFVPIENFDKFAVGFDTENCRIVRWSNP